MLSHLPIVDSTAAQIHTLENVMEAALKYGMENVEWRARKELIAPRFLEAELLRVFALAMQHRFEGEVRVAAKMTLRVPPLETPLETPHVSELDRITGSDLRWLYDYYSRCVAVSKNVATDLRWLNSEDWAWFICRQQGCKSLPPNCAFKEVTTSRNKMSITAAWWSNYMAQAAVNLASRPVEDTVLRNELIDEALLEAFTCSFCGPRARGEMGRFAGMFAAKVKRAIFEVCTYTYEHCRLRTACYNGIHNDPSSAAGFT
jgi:hypothetical protein